MGLEEARAAMASSFGSGPSSPDKINAQGSLPDAGYSPDLHPPPPADQDFASESDSDLDSNPENNNQPDQAPTEQKLTMDDIMDWNALGKKKFKIDGKIYTADDLKQGIHRLGDYTRKTQAVADLRKSVAEAKKFNEAFEEDLPKLLENPEKYEQAFKKIYPKEFHARWEKIKSLVQSRSQGNPGQQNQGAQESLNQTGNNQYAETIQELQERLDRIDQDQLQAKQSAANAELDRVMGNLAKKYDLGSPEDNKLLEELVLMKADTTDEKLTPKMWEQIYQEAHKRLTGLSKSHGRRIFQSQKEANQRGSDAAGNGGIPGSAPQQARTLKEARANFEAHLNKSSQMRR